MNIFKVLGVASVLFGILTVVGVFYACYLSSINHWAVDGVKFVNILLAVASVLSGFFAVCEFADNVTVKSKSSGE